jgi:hypothetical protein
MKGLCHSSAYIALTVLTPLVCALNLASVTALGAIANVAGDEIDAVAIPHGIGGVHGILEQFSRMDTCFSTMDRESSLRLGTLGAAVQTDILAALRRLDSLMSVAGTQGPEPP